MTLVGDVLPNDLEGDGLSCEVVGGDLVDAQRFWLGGGVCIKKAYRKINFLALADLYLSLKSVFEYVADSRSLGSKAAHPLVDHTNLQTVNTVNNADSLP